MNERKKNSLGRKVFFMLEKLALVSVLITLTTEAIKKILDELHFNYSSNVLASILSVFLSVGVQIYTLGLSAALMTSQGLYSTLALMFLAFLSATLGYEKVSQTINQIKR